MPEIDITKPEIIKFLRETYEKTERLRMRWNNLYGANIQEAAQFRGVEKGHDDASISKSIMVAEIVALSRDQLPYARNRMVRFPHDVSPKPLAADLRKEHSIENMGLGDPKIDPRLARPDTDCSPDPIMRPVCPEITKIIYEGSGFGLGRQEYLKIRNKIKPEEKYYFPEDVGWDYGWRMKDSYFGCRGGAMYPKVARLTKGSMNRSGPAPDPIHYAPVAKNIKEICDD